MAALSAFSPQGDLRDELRVVVFGPWQKAPLSPFEEASEGELGVAADLDLIPVRPDVQTDQHDANADRAVQLPDGRVLAWHSRDDRAIYVGGRKTILCVNGFRKEVSFSE